MMHTSFDWGKRAGQGSLPSPRPWQTANELSQDFGLDHDSGSLLIARKRGSNPLPCRPRSSRARELRQVLRPVCRCSWERCRTRTHARRPCGERSSRSSVNGRSLSSPASPCRRRSCRNKRSDGDRYAGGFRPACRPCRRQTPRQAPWPVSGCRLSLRNAPAPSIRSSVRAECHTFPPPTLA